MARIGLCEDDPAIRRIVLAALDHAGHVGVPAHDGREALQLFTTDDSLDVIVLDIGLPDADGRDVCQALRSAGQPAPVLFLTALGAVHDRLAGFSAGADDYLPKPFDVKELIARVEALAKRGRIVTGNASTDLLLDPARHALVCNDKEVLLTPTEFRMLAAITSRPGEVVRRRAIVAAAWPDGAMVSENTVDSYVRRIRVKLTEVGSPLQLRTVRGVGLTLR
ncbi:response regulator [Nocardioides sp. MAH-18]|uniref:Response regulator n=1 Tax=Nocardioides agri TaxID=2682843 RepID=A0A6L6XN41_9ACTN|nr:MULTISPECIES: response regulator transcription factor [unclassified Nocardioides]MBA2953769.1 response regulator transcription factor [Nocardioides sp. CGMCC 1.13656]MVQ48634.1 response regulator [Nocardioides sp. MAH-18]